VLENCRFFLARGKCEESLKKPFAEGDFVRLRLLKLIKLGDVEKEVGEFMDRNSLELEFSGEPSGEGVSS
jgi:hypothetical protein